jgi:hypothetical protein
MEEELLIETSKQSVSLQTKKLVPLTKGGKSILTNCMFKEPCKDLIYVSCFVFFYVTNNKEVDEKTPQIV